MRTCFDTGSGTTRYRVSNQSGRTYNKHLNRNAKLSSNKHYMVQMRATTTDWRGGGEVGDVGVPILICRFLNCSCRCLLASWVSFWFDFHTTCSAVCVSEAHSESVYQAVGTCCYNEKELEFNFNKKSKDWKCSKPDSYEKLRRTE